MHLQKASNTILGRAGKGGAPQADLWRGRWYAFRSYAPQGSWTLQEQRPHEETC